MSSSSTNKTDTPLISVVMPVYDVELYVAEAIRSILAQTYSNLEIIIVDDGSTDGSARIVREFAARDARIHPLFLAHRGHKHAIAAGVSVARGDLIARMDADDVALPHRFAIQVEWMRNKGVEICGSCGKRFGDENGFLWFPETHEAITNEMVFRAALLMPTVLMHAHVARADVLDDAFTEQYPKWTRLVFRYRMGNVPQVLLKHRCHAQQLHVRYSSAFFADVRKFREPYFHKLFADATAAEYALVARIVDQVAFCNLADLRQAGDWLVRLAQVNDVFLRARMGMRWYSACRQSASLGLGCYQLYREIAPRFGAVVSRRDRLSLSLACARGTSPKPNLIGRLHG